MLVTTGVQRNTIINTGTLAIKTGGSAIVKTSSDVYYYTNKLNKFAATDMAALSGTVTNAAFNVFVFYIDDTGTKSSKMGTEASALSGVKFPEISQGSIVFGFVIINPTGTGNFVGGTTALDDATVVPNAVYVNTNVGLYL